ncbi:hypothetical protein RAD15_06485 [Bradyrhizobium sp. 14AA]
MDKVEITSPSDLDAAFGDLGTNIGPRTGANKRTQEAKEWFVLRHFLSAALRVQMFELPIAISKTEPPAPDFTSRLGIAGRAALIEITEATHPDDQREMTEFERSGKSLMLLGDFGGRFADGASQPKVAWASDILDAILRKRDKSICTSDASDRHLVIYPNSSASQLLFDEGDEREAFAHLRRRLETERAGYSEALNGCRVHVVGKLLVGFDLTGTFSLKVREPRGCPAPAQNATAEDARAD